MYPKPCRRILASFLHCFNISLRLIALPRAASARHGCVPKPLCTGKHRHRTGRLYRNTRSSKTTGSSTFVCIHLYCTYFADRTGGTEGVALGVHGRGLQRLGGAARCHWIRKSMSGQKDLLLFSRPLQASCDSTCLRSSGSSEPDRQLSQATSKKRVTRAAHHGQ